MWYPYVRAFRFVTRVASFPEIMCLIVVMIDP